MIRQRHNEMTRNETIIDRNAALPTVSAIGYISQSREWYSTLAPDITFADRAFAVLLEHRLNGGTMDINDVRDMLSHTGTEKGVKHDS